MLYWSLVLVALSFVAAACGFSAVASTLATFAKVFFGLFAVLFVISLITGAMRPRSASCSSQSHELPEEFAAGSVIFVLALACFLTGTYVGGCSTGSSYRQQAIDRGYAGYNEKTGFWEWKPAAEKVAD